VKIFTYQRFAAGKEDHRAAEGSQIGNQPLSLTCCQFIGIINILGIRVTMDTLEIAPPGHVPDNHGLFVRRNLEEMGGKFSRFPTVAEDISGLYRSTVQF